MSDPVKIAILAGIALVALAAMRLGWRRRAARASAAWPGLPAVPALGEPILGPLEVTYLATARADDRLARLAAHGLAVRAAAEVEVHGAGVLVRRAGSADLFVPARALGAVARASGMAGTAVGTDRVVVLRWQHGLALDTGLLPRHPDDARRLADVIGALVGPPEGTPEPSSAPTEGSPA